MSGEVRTPRLTEQTLMSLGVVTLLVGLAFWVGTIFMMVQRHDKDISDLKTAMVQDRAAVAEKMDRATFQLGQITARLDIILDIRERERKR